MASIIFDQDPIGAILIGGTAFEYEKRTCDPITDDNADVQYSNIQGVTCTRSDPQGKTVYSESERALAHFECGTGTISSAGRTMDNVYNKIFKVDLSDPSSLDDESQNWQVGGFWVNSSTGEVYRATDVSINFAVWEKLNTKRTLTPFDFGVIRIFCSDSSSSRVNEAFVTDRAHRTNDGDTEVTSWPWNLWPGDFVDARGLLSSEFFSFSFLPCKFPDAT